MFNYLCKLFNNLQFCSKIAAMGLKLSQQWLVGSHLICSPMTHWEYLLLSKYVGCTKFVDNVRTELRGSATAVNTQIINT